MRWNSASLISTTNAPSIAGIDMMKEYVTANLRVIPVERNAAIVVPDHRSGMVAIS